MRLRSGLLAVAVLAVSFASQTSEASPIIFTDRADFDAVVHPEFLVPFDGPFEYRGGNGNWLSDNTLLSFSTGFTIPSFPGDGAFHIFPFNGAQYSLLDGSSIFAMGIDVSTAAASPIRVVASVGFHDELHTFMVTGTQFIGLIFEAPLLSGLNLDVFTTGQDFFTPLLVDNIAIGTTPVPEPATALLVLAGAAVLLQRRRFLRAK
jgi:hypothetical protein